MIAAVRTVKRSKKHRPMSDEEFRLMMEEFDRKWGTWERVYQPRSHITAVEGVLNKENKHDAKP